MQANTDLSKENNPDALLAEGVAHSRAGRFEAAMGCFDRSAGLLPSNTAPLVNRAWVLKRLRRYDEALDNYRQAIALQPGNAELHWNLALLLLGRFAEGFAELS